MEHKDIEVYIEISRNSNIKYEYDHEKHALVCDRVLHTPFAYPFNYGFIENTLSCDGDPIDVVVIMNHELIPGSYIKCKLLGCLETSDEKGDDPKIITCPIKKIDPTFEYNDIKDLPKHTLDQTRYFFEHYKDLEHKKVTVGEFVDKTEALKIIQESVLRYNQSI